MWRPVLLLFGELLATPSLADYAVFQPRLHGGNNMYASRLQSSLPREWTLACCVFHPCQDGRIAWYAQRHGPECPGGAPRSTLLHAIRVCPLSGTERAPRKGKEGYVTTCVSA